LPFCEPLDRHAHAHLFQNKKDAGYPTPCRSDSLDNAERNYYSLTIISKSEVRIIVLVSISSPKNSTAIFISFLMVYPLRLFVTLIIQASKRLSHRFALHGSYKAVRLAKKCGKSMGKPRWQRIGEKTVVQ